MANSQLFSTTQSRGHTAVAQPLTGPEVSVVLPCLNEAETIDICLQKIWQAFDEAGVDGEIIVADNGSTDASAQLARLQGARVVNIRQKGYGNALRGGIAAAQGRYVIMGDADDSYNFLELPRLLQALRAGNELVMGNRFQGGIKPGAMPFLHRYLGNPVLSFIGRLFFRIPVGDFHCGLRGFSKAAYERWQLQTTGMEFASEMVVKASLQRSAMAEVPVTLSPDGRTRPPHLKTWRDGWRHLHFLLIHSPRWLFVIPGLLLLLLGVVTMAWLLPQPRQISTVEFDVNTLLLGSAAVMMGQQLVHLGFIGRINSALNGVLPVRPWIDTAIDPMSINRGVFGGLFTFLLGLTGTLYSVSLWKSVSFGALNPHETLRLTIPSVLLLITGLQFICTSFLVSMIATSKRSLVTP